MKLSQLDKVLAGIDQEIATLQAARLRIVQQQQRAPKQKAPAEKKRRWHEGENQHGELA